MRVAMQRLCKRGRLSVALALLLCGALAGPLHAAPRVPVHDGEALERLPHPATDPVARELRALRAQLSRAPNDLPLAVQLARRYIEHGRRTGDPRYYGYAEAALQPWWHVPEPPAQIRVLRATLAQGRHDFDSALHDLTLALKMDARNAQAWLTRAAIL
jgi:Flp pilus assembly protein TadD